MSTLRYRQLSSSAIITPVSDSSGSVDEAEEVVGRLTLTESLLIVSLSDSRGYVGSLLDDCLSACLRVCLFLDFASAIAKDPNARVRFDSTKSFPLFLFKTSNSNNNSSIPLSERHVILEGCDKKSALFKALQEFTASASIAKLLTEVADHLASASERHSLSTWISIWNGIFQEHKTSFYISMALFDD